MSKRGGVAVAGPMLRNCCRHRGSHSLERLESRRSQEIRLSQCEGPSGAQIGGTVFSILLHVPAVVSAEG